MLFLIYINDLPSIFKAFSFHLFAVDTNIYFKCSDIVPLQKVMNRDLRKIRKWLDANHLVKILYYSLFTLLLLMESLSRAQHINRTLILLSSLQNKTLRATTFSEVNTLRAMTFSEVNAHTTPLFSQLGILKVHDVDQFQLLSFVYACHYKLAPVHFHSYFKPSAEVHNYSTRTASRVIFFSKGNNYISVWN